MAVFFPSLMGIGIIISGTLLISDWLRRLFPKGNLRRKHNVVVGTYGVVEDAVEAAGYHINEPWFINRWLRPRLTYLGTAAGCITLGSISIWAGRRLFNDPLGLFYRSPWATGIGYGVAAALFLVAVICLALTLSYRSPPGALVYLVRETTLGRIVLPSGRDHNAALTRIEKEP